MSTDLDLIRKASDAAPHRLYGPIATLVQDALAHAENVVGFSQMVGAVKPGGTAERQINGGVALAKAVLAMPPLGVSGEDRSEPTPAPRRWQRGDKTTWRGRVVDVIGVTSDGKGVTIDDHGEVLFDRDALELSEVVSPEGTS